MSLHVIIPPKWAATAAARSAEARSQTTDTLNLDIFCDGSFKPHPPRAGIGIVANIWLPQIATKERTSKACSIPCGFRYKEDDNNTTEAFALAEGAHVALEQISKIKKDGRLCSTTRIEVIFWSDSKLVLTALEDSRWARSRSLPNKMQHILDIIRLKTQELFDLWVDVSVLFRWCPEECVEPHLTADQLSKGARMSGRSMYSKPLALLHGVPHSTIQSSLRQFRRMPPAIQSVAQSFPGGASSSVATKAAEPLVPETASLATTNHATRHPPQHPALARDPALEPIIKDPVIMNVLYRAAGSPRFFSIVGGMAECLPSNLRSSMQEAILEQRRLNKVYDRSVQNPFNGREQNLQPSSSRRYPNLFAIIEIAAWKLPAVHRDNALTAIKLQKEANAHLVQDEVEGQVYQFEGSDAGDMDHELEAFGEPEAPEDNMSLEESEVSEESAGIIDESEVVEEPAMVAQEHKLSDTGDLDEPMDLDEPLDLDRAEALDEHDIIDETDVPAEIIDTIQEPRALEEPEPIEEPRPNRMRAVWAWFERKIARL